MYKPEEKLVRLPSVEEIKEWCQEKFAPLNPDYKDFLLIGVEALYVHLGGEKFLVVKMPGEKKDW